MAERTPFRSEPESEVCYDGFHSSECPSCGMSVTERDAAGPSGLAEARADAIDVERLSDFDLAMAKAAIAKEEQRRYARLAASDAGEATS